MPAQFVHAARSVFLLIAIFFVFDRAAAQCIGCINTLPLHHLDLSSFMQGNDINLKWLAENEFNTQAFLVQRSTDGINYITIDTMGVSGPPNIPTNYQYTDNLQASFQAVVIYYRVLATDNASKYGYSNIIQLHLNRKPIVQVWPNPFDNSINISYSVPGNTPVDILLTDNTGRVLKQMHYMAYHGLNQFSLSDLDELSHGLYIIHIKNQNADGYYLQKLLK